MYKTTWPIRKSPPKNGRPHRNSGCRQLDRKNRIESRKKGNRFMDTAIVDRFTMYHKKRPNEKKSQCLPWNWSVYGKSATFDNDFVRKLEKSSLVIFRFIFIISNSTGKESRREKGDTFAFFCVLKFTYGISEIVSVFVHKTQLRRESRWVCTY